MLTLVVRQITHVHYAERRITLGEFGLIIHDMDMATSDEESKIWAALCCCKI